MMRNPFILSYLFVAPISDEEILKRAHVLIETSRRFWTGPFVSGT